MKLLNVLDSAQALSSYKIMTTIQAYIFLYSLDEKYKSRTQS